MPPKKYDGLNRKKSSISVSNRKNATKTAPASRKKPATKTARKLKASLSTSIFSKPPRKTTTSATQKKTAKRARVDEKPEPTTQETTASELGPETQEDSKSEDPDQDEGEDHDDATGVEDDGDEEVSTQLETAAATAEFLKSVNTSMEARHKAKRQKLQDQHRAAVEKIEKDIRERSRRQAKEFAKYRNEKLALLMDLIKQRTEVEKKIEASVRRIEDAYSEMYKEFRARLEETIAMAGKGKQKEEDGA